MGSGIQTRTTRFDGPNRGVAPRMVSLKKLLPQSSFVACTDILVNHVTEFSGECTPGSTFAALPGTRSDGRQHALAAVNSGATAVLTSHPLPGLNVRQCITRDVRAAYGRLCQAIYGHPTQRLGTVGVTGTNGKTTVTWMVRSMLNRSGLRCGVLGTIEYSSGLHSQPSRFTTPPAGQMARFLAETIAAQSTHIAMELSSHGLVQQRTAGVWLDVAIVTNITQDHFDYHTSFAEYVAAKSRIAELVKAGGLVIVNADDPGAMQILGSIPARGQLLTIGIDKPANLTARILEETHAGTRLHLETPNASGEVRLPLIGRHNVSNALAAVAAVQHFGLSWESIHSGLESFPGVPGRLERVDINRPFQVWVDYAHTEDALARIIASVRQATPGRVICIFGAGGDRDRTKRPHMGRAAGAADLVILTSDNPRSENPSEIIDQIAAGYEGDSRHLLREPDRRAAIELGLSMASENDSVIIAGKGHERTQTIGTQHLPFDDCEVVRSWGRQL